MPAPIKAALATSPDIERKVNILLARMTLAEKIGQLNQVGTSIYGGDLEKIAQENRPLIKAGGLGSILSLLGTGPINTLQKIAVEESRLGIPLLFGYDIIHGCKTITPIPLGEAAGWDPSLAKAAAAMAAKEARSMGVQWVFAPMVDIARDPRWGRIAEGAGEDTYLGCAMAKARVQGFQGEKLGDPDHVVACAKHFAAYGAAEGGRDYNTVSMSEQQFREVYLPPFAAAVQAGVGTLMCAFHDFNGVPCSGSRFLLTQVLREEMGFNGFVVSDCMSIQEILDHGFAADRADAGMKSITAGVDMDMASHIFIKELAALVKNKKVPVRIIDQAVRRILRIKFLMGLFENPYTDLKKEKTVILCPEHRALARKAARESMVLLKNQGHLLPLSKNIKCLAVLGPLADSRYDCLGAWAPSGEDKDVITPLAGIMAAITPQTTVLHTKGCGMVERDEQELKKAAGLAQKADVVLLFVGEEERMSGEARCRVSLDLPLAQDELVKAVHAVGKPVVAVLMNGRSLSIPWLAEHVPTILEAWHPGVESGPAIAEVLFGGYNPGGKLPVTFPDSVGQVPLYYNHPNTGRPYKKDVWWTSKYFDGSSFPVFPFGFGLSYTTFAYTNLRLSSRKMTGKKGITVSTDIQNTGQVAGAEVVQLYVRDLVASRVRPVKELKGFKKIFLAPGEKQTVTFQLTVDDLKFYSEKMKLIAESGDFKVWVGTNSQEGLEGEFTLKV